MKIIGFVSQECGDILGFAGIKSVCPDTMTENSLDLLFQKLLDTPDLCLIIVSADIADIIRNKIETHSKSGALPLVHVIPEKNNSKFNENYIIDYIFQSTGMKV
ncbi:hypothetical protein KA977_06620 [Candidatus Dependentiae bacterium]|nr:hypothetical protein [Candidatus Dependentiae bacterium]